MSSCLKFATVAGISATGMAYGQTTPWFLRAGGFWPFSSTVRDNSSSLGPVAGLGYVIAGSGTDKQGSLEFVFSHLSGTNTFDNYDFQYTERISMHGNAPSGFYYGLGAGVRLATYRVASAAGSGGSGGASSHSQATVVGEALFGYQFDKHFSMELSARVAPSIQGQNTSGLTLLANYRF